MGGRVAPEILVRVQFFGFFEQLLLRFLMVGIGNAAIDRADRRTLHFIEMSNAFRTETGIDDKYIISLGYGIIGALRLAGGAVDTFISDYGGHSLVLLEKTSYQAEL
jgi:hypothetical protein